MVRMLLVALPISPGESHDEEKPGTPGRNLL
jgi:hypothetical protein